LMHLFFAVWQLFSCGKLKADSSWLIADSEKNFLSFLKSMSYEL